MEKQFLGLNFRGETTLKQFGFKYYYKTYDFRDSGSGEDKRDRNCW